MKKLRGSKISSPFVELECGGRVIRSDGISNARKNDNFFSRHFITMEMVYIYKIATPIPTFCIMYLLWVYTKLVTIHVYSPRKFPQDASFLL